MLEQSSPVRSYISDHWAWIIIILILSVAVGVVFDYLFKAAFAEAFLIVVKSNNLNPPSNLPKQLDHIASYIAIFLAVIFLSVIEVSHFLIDLHQRVLLAIEAEGDERPGLFKQLLYRFDPVDEATVQFMRDDLTHMTNYFASITHVHAKSWFAGENYLTLLLCQAYELVNRKINRLSQPPPTGAALSADGENNEPKMFRILVSIKI